MIDTTPCHRRSWLNRSSLQHFILLLLLLLLLLSILPIGRHTQKARACTRC